MPNFQHIGGSESWGLDGKGSGSGLGLGQENNSWTAQYRYMVTVSDHIDWISMFGGNSAFSFETAKKYSIRLGGLISLSFGLPMEIGATRKKRILNTFEACKTYLDSGFLEEFCTTANKCFILLLEILKEGYTFKKNKSNVRIRQGVAGDIDELMD